MKTLFKKLMSPKWEILLWVGVLGFVGYRFGPQVGAALGIGGEDTEVTADVSIETLDGELLTLEGLKGQVVLVNLWATWCPPCVLEMPGFQRVYEEYKDQGFTILGISRDQGEPSMVRTFLQQKGITYPVAMAWQASLEEFEVGGLPTSFLLGRDGRIKHRVEGVFAEPALRMAVRVLLEDPVPTEDDAAAGEHD
jgi:cytochrome c biogenesis protein CcmG/thiol:disulfide interchange protein DsbE